MHGTRIEKGWGIGECVKVYNSAFNRSTSLGTILQKMEQENGNIVYFIELNNGDVKWISSELMECGS
ncbi:MAG: hypothetical protein Q4C49_04770 [Bacillota bacterium]|nr:hypothetical protein [Bacillota bacterium]